MSDPAKPPPEDRMDRYVRGELTPAEARALAQESLDAQDLFDELADAALAKAALSAGPVPETRIVQFPAKRRLLIGGVAAGAAAAILLVSLYAVKPARPVKTVAGASAKPVLSFSASPEQPVLLASGLQPEPDGAESTDTFRGSETAGRAPRIDGEVVSIEDGVATVDLGSIDGLGKGIGVDIFHDAQSAEPSGVLAVATVFRERARGRILRGRAPQVHDRLRVPGGVHLGALLQQVDALASRGDSNAARAVAEKAVEWAQAQHLSAAQQSDAGQRLAALEYRAGALQAAEAHYRSAADNLNTGPPAPASQQSLVWNNLAVLRMLQGDYPGAEAALNQAVAIAPKDVSYGRNANNLGVLAELRGDRSKAETFYTRAMSVFTAAGSPAQERKAVEANLARVRGSQ